MFNNLALWGEKKFVSVLKRTYKFQRGVNNILDCHANQTRILSKKYSFVAGDYVRSTARNDVKRHTEDNSPKYRMVGKIYQCLTNVDKRLRNKCVMTDVEGNILSLGGESGCLNEVKYNHERGLKHELINNEPSLEFLSSSQLTKKFNPQHKADRVTRIAQLCGSLCLTKREGNNSTDTVFSRFTSHFSLRKAGATHVALCYSVGSYYRHWCGAFTLAEVLVTLGIIGVVSAMTVPTLMQNYQRQSYVTQLHKTYNEFSQALLRYQTDRNALNLTEAGLNSQEACNNLMTTYFKTVQTCTDSLTPCFANSYKSLQGGTIAFDTYTSYVLASGTSVRFMYHQVGGTNKVANITVDINGKKGPNILGRDLFWMALYSDGTIDDFDYTNSAPLSESLRDAAYNTYCQGSGQVPGYGCFGKILNDNWQMTY